MNILITGGAGYIGSHTSVELIQAGHRVIIYDNYHNSKPAVLARIQHITGVKPIFVEGDVRDQTQLESTLRTHQCEAVIHFAGHKAVGESVQKPLQYYDNNVGGTQKVLAAMQACNVKNIVFSSSATVYGEPKFLPYTEDHPLNPTSPYGHSKRHAEDMLRDFSAANPDFGVAILRYFNPVGAHPSGLIGEDPQGIPNNLMPFITQVAVGKRAALSVFGDDYDTVDGTGVRDYIHVVDLAEGHLAALNYLSKHPGLLTLNLGVGQGVSVLELLAAFEKASHQKIPYTIEKRRAGDIAAFYADPKNALMSLGWSVKRNVETMCLDSWNWQSKNPKGYE